MKKKIIAVTLITVMLGLCACARTEEVSESTEEYAVTEAEPVVSEAETTEAAEKAEEEVTETTENATLHLTCTTVREGKSLGENYEGSAYITYPKFSLFDADAEMYSELQKTLNTLNDSCEADYDERLSELYEIGESAVEDEAASYSYLEFYHSLTPEVCRADSHIVSIRENYSTYTGGAHGYYAFYGVNYDTQTGEELAMRDVVSDMDSFKETVKEKLYAQYPEEPFDNLDEALDDMDNDEYASIWTMDYSGITLYFNPYHIAAYASGMQVVTVPFNENPDIFVQDYLDVPETFAEKLNSHAPVITDVNGDGMNEAIYVEDAIPEGEMNDEGYDTGYRDWIIHCGEESVKVTDYCYRADCYLVHANDQYYVHVFEVGDSDYSLLTSVDLKTKAYDSDKVFNAFLTGYDAQYDYDDDGYRSVYTEAMYTDPECVYLSSRTNVLGTNTGVKLYSIGEDGWLKSESGNYDVYPSMVYTAKQDIECIVVDEDGNETGKATLKAGRYYHLVKTDDERYAYIQELNEDEIVIDEEYLYITSKETKGYDSSRPMYRLEVDVSSWPFTINGMPEEELLDGILYAG